MNSKNKNKGIKEYFAIAEHFISHILSENTISNIKALWRKELNVVKIDWF